MKSKLRLSLLGACALLASSVAWAGAGAYTSSTVGPNVFSKNVISTKTFNPLGAIPAGSKISNVQYSYSTSYRPSGFQAYLCWDSSLSYCANITSSQNGSTSIFNDGRSPNHSFVLVHRVVGTGTLSPPVYGNSDQITVTFTY